MMMHHLRTVEINIFNQKSPVSLFYTSWLLLWELQQQWQVKDKAFHDVCLAIHFVGSLKHVSSFFKLYASL